MTPHCVRSVGKAPELGARALLDCLARGQQSRVGRSANASVLTDSSISYAVRSCALLVARRAVGARPRGDLTTTRRHAR